MTHKQYSTHDLIDKWYFKTSKINYQQKKFIGIKAYQQEVFKKDQQETCKQFQTTDFNLHNKLKTQYNYYQYKNKKFVKIDIELDVAQL